MATPERKRLNVEWNGLPEHIGFTVSYRLAPIAGVEGSAWEEVQTKEQRATVYGLKNGGTYEYRVGSYCVAGEPVYSPVFSVTLPMTDSARLAQCGIMPAIDLTNHEPLKELKTGEVIMANDYPVTITRVSGADGVFTGEGWTLVPWLEDAKVAVQFTGITVNTDKQMTQGYIDAKYAHNGGQIGNVDDVFEGGFDVGTVKTGITKIDYKFDYTIPGAAAFSLNEEGELIITDREGVPHTVTAEDKTGQGNEGNKVVVFPMTVEDKDGNIYQVEKVTETDATGQTKGVAKATYIGQAGAPLAEGSFDPAQLIYDKAIVTFIKGEGKYAFDEWKAYYENVALIKPKYEKLYTGYYVPWKFLPASGTDVVSATIALYGENIDPKKVIFKTPKGTKFKADYHEGTYTLHLAAGPADDVQELYALYPTGDKYWNLGKLSIASYAPQTHKVVLVSVNGAPVDEPAIKQKLQQVYRPVAITWQVEKDVFAYSSNGRLMENSTGLSTYNEAMRALNNAYKASNPAFDKKANYLFFLKATGHEQINNRDAIGFMPRGAQFGYIFTSEVEDIHEPATVAHELGHGRWKLFHTFDKHYGGFERQKTDNVMDYTNQTHLAKWQWDVMSDPAMVVSVFEGDEASARTAEFDVKFSTYELEVITECGERDYNRGRDLYVKHNFIVSAFGAFIEFGLCQTEEDKCDGKDYEFVYGFTNAFLQELDIATLLDLIAEIRQNQLECLRDNIHFDIIAKSTLKTEEALYRDLTKCTLGIEFSPGELQTAFDAIEKFVGQVWTDPYERGQATEFFVSLFLPASKLSKVSKIAQTRRINTLLKIEKSTTFNKARHVFEEVSKRANGDVEELKRILESDLNKAARSFDDLLASLKNKIPADKWNDFISDFGEDVSLVFRFDETPELVDAWRVIRSADPALAARATDISELELVSKYLDDIAVAGGYKNWKAFDNLFSSYVSGQLESLARKLRT